VVNPIREDRVFFVEKREGNLKKLLAVLVIASVVGGPCALIVGVGGHGVASAAVSSGPSVQAHATFNGYVILTVTGTGFAPTSPFTISVQSSLLNFVVSDPSYVTDATGSLSFGPDEIVAACHNGVVKGTATVTDGAGNTATGRWSTVCKPLH
jgi:hypothetical protein